MQKKINKNKGLFIRVSGLPGSGKTEISRKLLPKIKNLYGPTIMWSGDDLRRIFRNRKYNIKERYLFGISNVKLAAFINNQKINVIFATVGLNEKIRQFTKKKIKNYIEVLIYTNITKIKKLKIRKFYTNGSMNVWGNDIKPEFPKNPDIKIKNNFKKDINLLVEIILKKINKIIK